MVIAGELMNSNFDLQTIIPKLLANVPEIAQAYSELLQNEKMNAEKLSTEDISELNQIAEMHNLPKHDMNKPGVTIVFEQLLVKFILELKQDKKSANRLKEIMDWIEKLANHPEFAVRNLVAVSICEPFITVHESSLSYLVPLMGEKTKELCSMQFELFWVSDETKRLFGVE